MPSPFPGMNPFLEQADTWEDFHQSFLKDLRDHLSGRVGDNYFVKIEVRLYLHERSAEERRFIGRADVGITTSGAPRSQPAATLTAPMQLQMPAVDIERHSSLEIRDRRNRRLVTAIELLSPSNKTRGSDRDDYLAKRRELLATTNLVEIDLRRGGTRPSPPEIPPCDYYVLLSRLSQREKLDFWPFALRDQPPIIPIPLVEPDADLLLDLKALLDVTYDAAGYGKYIYAETPDPPLTAEDERWARSVLGASPPTA